MNTKWFCLDCGDDVKDEGKQWHTDVKHRIIPRDQVRVYDNKPKQQEKGKDKNEKRTIKKVKGKILEYFVESVIVDGQPSFLCCNLDTNEISIKKEIESEDKIFKPIETTECGYTPYQFTNSEIISAAKNRINKEKLLDETKRLIDKFIVVNELAKHLVLGDIALSYHQEQVNTVHYPFFVGETESGKSSAVHLFRHLGYRCLYGDDVPNADIYNFLGIDEEGAGMIAEDEAQDIAKNRDKIKTYKNSYSRGSLKARIVTTSYSKTQVFYKTFCLKVFAGERIPDDKGFRERLAVVNMLEGSPESNIKMLTDPEKKELLQLRNAFLLYKMQNLSSNLSKLETELKQRDRELWEGFLQVVHGTKYFAKCMETAAFYTNQRHETIWNSLESRIFKLVKHKLTQNLDLRLEEFWQYLINEQDILSGVTEKETFFPHDFSAKITRNYLSKLLEQKFYAKRKSTYRTDAGKKHLMTAYQFNTEIISTLTKKYNVTDDVMDDLALDATSGRGGGSGQLTLGFESKADHVDHVDDPKEAKNAWIEPKNEPKPARKGRLCRCKTCGGGGEFYENTLGSTGMTIKSYHEKLGHEIEFLEGDYKDVAF